jgi:hypothetical protein
MARWKLYAMKLLFEFEFEFELTVEIERRAHRNLVQVYMLYTLPTRIT